MFEPSVASASAVVALGVCALHTRRTRGTIQRLERETEELKVENAAEKTRREAAEAEAAAVAEAGREADTRADTKLACLVLLLLFLLLIFLLQVLPISISTEAVAVAAVVVVAAEEGARREGEAKAAAQERARRVAEDRAEAAERAQRAAQDRAEAAERAQRVAEAALAAKRAEHAAALEALNGVTLLSAAHANSEAKRSSEAVEDLRRYCGSWSSKGPTQQTKKEQAAALKEQLTGRRSPSGFSETKRCEKHNNGLSGDRPSMEVVNDDGSGA